MYMAMDDLPHARGDEPAYTRQTAEALANLPHARGDEPMFVVPVHLDAPICPTHVGMNRSGSFFRILLPSSAPRTWG